MIRFRTIRARMVAVTMLAFVLVVAVLAGAAVAASGEAMRVAIDADLQRRGEDFARVVLRDRRRGEGGPPDGGPPDGGPPGAGARRRRLTSDWTAPAHLVVGSDSETAYDPQAYAAGLKGHEIWTTVQEGDEPHRVFTVPVQKAGEVRDVVQVATGMRATEEQLGLLRWTLLATVVPLGLLLGGLASVLVVGRLLRPLRHLNAEAVRIGESGLGERLTATGDDEFAGLTRTLNGMVGRLEAAVETERRSAERQRRFTGDASHELKTPLAVIKTYLGALKRSRKSVAEEADAVSAMDRAADRMTGLIGDLLTLARSDDGVMGERTPCRLDEVAREAVGAVPSAAGRVEVQAVPVWVAGDASELARLFTNLIENALRHSGSEAPIRVEVAAEGGTAVATVADQGVGIAPEHLPHLFERFYRADASRTAATGGNGLGLAIAESIVHGHGGAISVASVVGEGARFTVRLPRTDAPKTS